MDRPHPRKKFGEAVGMPNSKGILLLSSMYDQVSLRGVVSKSRRPVWLRFPISIF